MFEFFTSKEIENYAEIARRIWFRRNNVIHGRIFLHPNELFHMATSLMADYRSAMEPDQIERELEIPPVLVDAIQWCPPPSGMHKSNWDAAIDTRNGKLGFGCTVRDIHGTVLVAFCHMVDTVVDPVVAEVLVALRTVEFCKNRGFTLIILEGDSLLVVQAINS